MFFRFKIDPWFLSLIRHNDHRVHYVDFSSYNLVFQEISLLKDAFENNNSVEYLYLGSNNLHYQSLQKICELISSNTSLRTLCLSGNRLTRSSVELLVQALIRHPSMQYVDLSFTGLKEDSADILCALFERNTRIIELGLSVNFLTQKTINKIKTALKDNQLRLQRLERLKQHLPSLICPGSPYDLKNYFPAIASYLSSTDLKHLLIATQVLGSQKLSKTQPLLFRSPPQKSSLWQKVWNIFSPSP